MPFKGTALVAFLDILGFSKSVAETWDQEHSTLDTLLALKRKVVSGMGPIRIKAANNDKEWHCSVSTVSDSLLMTHGLEENYTNHDLLFASMNIWMAMQLARECALDVGYAIRGGIELGPAYFEGHEVIGPAFISAYVLESKVAKVARVLPGPKLLAGLSECTDSPFSGNLPETLHRSDDGLLSFRPFSELLPKMKALQDTAGPAAYKYNDFLDSQSKTRHMKKATRSEFSLAASRVEAALADAMRGIPADSHSAGNTAPPRPESKRGKRRQRGRRS